jgi:hypothetical protein
MDCKILKRDCRTQRALVSCELVSREQDAEQRSNPRRPPLLQELLQVHS